MVSARDMNARSNRPARGFDVFDGAPVRIARDERRMHVRAYNHWVSLLHGRPFPLIDDLDPSDLADFGPSSVLLDFTSGHADPVIRYLGDRLREECGAVAVPDHLNEVPSRSLLSRLTDQYHRIIATRTPIGFEAEFVSRRGHETLYRGILMPFSATGESIDYLYGVINWKELVDADTQARLDAELARAREVPRRTPPIAAIWADGPGGTVPEASGDRAADRLRTRPALAHVALEAGEQEFALLVARRGAASGLDIVARIDGDDPLVRAAILRAAD
ncbi:hypothetical protein EV664_10691 [Stakelama pacifica]|uniref:PAS domain-containing protein n=2 Tax=Stakelama pacifica TaxID=517720 RepID=A0A4R6FNL0_9SPHN|nr:hypothetical protein EV664_10691 [Stakelama pacifica]GGO95755.1 hypothetical protein GCM10011329_20650 [Stakelama pacifica]